MKASEALDMANHQIQKNKDSIIPRIEQDIIQYAKDGLTCRMYFSPSLLMKGMNLLGEDNKVEGWLKENGYKYSISDGYLEYVSRE